MKMDINLLFKIAAIGILVAVLHQVLVRAGREDQAMMTTLAGLVIVLTMVIKFIIQNSCNRNISSSITSSVSKSWKRRPSNDDYFSWTSYSINNGNKRNKWII